MAFMLISIHDVTNFFRNMHMSRLSQQLRRLAAARQVSMENAETTVQGQEGNLSQEELAKVASDAEKTVTDDSTETTDASSTAPDNAEVTGDATGDVATDTPTDVGGDETTSATDDSSITPEAVADTDTAGQDDVDVSDIQTPAETEMAEDLTANAQEVVEAEAAASAPTDAGSDVSSDPLLDSSASTTSGDTATSSDTTVTEPSVATTGEPTETTQAAATIPSKSSDTSEAVQEVVELTEALATAQSAEEVVKEANEVREEAKEVVETVEVINENGGASMESLALLIPRVNSIGRRMGRDSVNLGISMESFSGMALTDRLKVSLEEVEWMVDEIDVTLPQLERQAIESLDRVVDALKDALPAARDRLRAVVSLASNSTDEREGAPVQIGDGVGAALSCGEGEPDVANQLQAYAQFGKAILGLYTDAAIKAARTASLINNSIVFSSPAAFWEKIDGAVSAVVDPRMSLTCVQVESCLPGGARLFGEAFPTPDAPNKTLCKLFEYNDNYPPLETTVVVKGKADSSTTLPALSASKIVLVGKALLDVLCLETIEAKLDESQKLWPEAQDVVRHLRETLENPPQEIDNACGADFSQIQKFIEVNYSLATWPLLNYLTNLVLTVNAFVVFAERSLKADIVTEETTDDVDGDMVDSDLEMDVDVEELSLESLKEVLVKTRRALRIERKKSSGR